MKKYSLYSKNSYYFLCFDILWIVVFDTRMTGVRQLRQIFPNSLFFSFLIDSLEIYLKHIYKGYKCFEGSLLINEGSNKLNLITTFLTFFYSRWINKMLVTIVFCFRTFLK